ncbi:MAG: Ig-like domain-containing protein [Bacilli bacterium]|nr:Ig-like domain-containing protein [Bacilli bacterium]
MRKTSIRSMSLLFLALGATLVSCGGSTSSAPMSEPTIVRTTFYLSSSSEKVHVNDSFTLSPRSYVSSENLKWISSDSNIVSVDQTGLVKALSIGEATVTAYDSTAYGTCKVSVVNWDDTFFVTLSADSIVLNSGESYGIKPTLRTNEQIIESEFGVTLFEEDVQGVASFIKEGDRFVFTALNSGTAIYSFVTTYGGESYGANLTIKVN